MRSAYYVVDLSPGWRLIVLDTTELSLHGGHAEGSAELQEAEAYYAKHCELTRVQRYNGGIGRAQLAWLVAQLRKAEADKVRVIVASHHPLPPGSSAETHRAWNGDEVAAALTDSPAFVLGLAGHYHPGGHVRFRGRDFVTVPALLESPAGGNAYAVVQVTPDTAPKKGFVFAGGVVQIDGCGTTVPNFRFVV